MSTEAIITSTPLVTSEFQFDIIKVFVVLGVAIVTSSTS
jgi:hypothetical protein